MILFFVLINYNHLIGQLNNSENHLFEGNESHQKEVYINSESSYRKSISMDNDKSIGYYNLGNTHYRSKDYDPASQRYFQSQKKATSKLDKHKAFHNMGNVYMKKKEYQKAVESYKNALRNNSLDNETRYNYVLAKELLDKQEKENQNKDSKSDEKEKKKNDKDSKSDDKEGDEKDSKSDNKKSDQKDNNGSKSDNKKGEQKDKQDSENKESSQNKPGQLSNQQIKSLLDAMNKQEKEVQDKVNRKKVKGAPIKNEKDW